MRHWCRFTTLQQLLAIKAAQKVFPDLPMSAIFDTAYHQSMPEEEYLYALPYSLYKEHSIRRYGMMHGASHLFIAREEANRLGKAVPELNIINCHLSKGASVCAIKNGKSVDTSMSLTLLEGLVTGTRCGDLDPAIIFHLHDTLEYSTDNVN